MVVERGDDTKNVFIVLVITNGCAVGLKERNILGAGELLRELIDIDRLEIRVNLLKGEGFLGHEIDNILLVI